MKYQINSLNIVLALLLICGSICFGTQYEYDSLNRLSKVTHDNNVQVVYSYDDSGNQTARVISLKPDITNDNAVDTLDLIELSSTWLSQPCFHPDWCSSCDLDLNGKVDLSDLANLAEHWLESE